MDTFGLIQLAELIYEFSSLESKISDRLKELGLSCWEYGGYLRVEPKEWDKLIELITVNETYFFREEPGPYTRILCRITKNHSLFAQCQKKYLRNILSHLEMNTGSRIQ